jgi:hypothetical protein
MKKYNKINPIGLKGNQINERMIHLMGIKPINENKNNYVVELTKMGPDGKAYAIVRENHEYYIKVTNKTSNIVAEDFKYIGGLQNKKSEAYPSYAKATKHLNLRFNSLAEAYNYNDDINVLEDDNLLNENAFAAGFSSQGGNGFSGEGNLEGNEEMYKEETVYEYDEKAMQNFIDQYGEERGKQIYYATANKQDRDPETFEKTEGMTSMGDDVELTDYEQAIEEMMARMEEKEGIEENIPSRKYWIVGKDTKGNTLTIIDALYDNIESAEEALKNVDIKSNINLKHLDPNTVKIEQVPSGPNWDALFEYSSESKIGKNIDEVSDEGKYTWKDLGDFGHNMIGDFVEYNGEYYKVFGNGTIDDENGEPVYSAGLENVKDGHRIEVSIHDITKINPNDVGIEWGDDKDVDFDSEVSDIEGKYNINSKYDDYLKESIAKIDNMIKALSEGTVKKKVVTKKK